MRASSRLLITIWLGLAVVLLGCGVVFAPAWLDAGRWLAASGDEVRLAELGVQRALTKEVAAAEIAAALDARDPELAQSFIDLAAERSIDTAAELRQKTAAMAAAQQTATHKAGNFVRGFVVGDPDDLAGLAGTAVGDLFVYGDIRDVVREGTRMARGESSNELVFGLACVGLAITAGTYATLGAGTPARIGLSLVKAASKTGRIGKQFGAALTRSLREGVDGAAVRQAMSGGSLLRPARAVRAAGDAVKVDRTGGLLVLAQNVGSVQSKIGTRGTLDALKLVEHPSDVAKLAKLAQAKGGKTRAVLKLLGRGALGATIAAFTLTSWLFWALVNLIWLVIALKALSERTTLRVIRAGKLRRARRAERLAFATPALAH